MSRIIGAKASVEAIGLSRTEILMRTIKSSGWQPVRLGVPTGDNIWRKLGYWIQGADDPIFVQVLYNLTMN